MSTLTQDQKRQILSQFSDDELLIEAFRRFGISLAPADPDSDSEIQFTPRSGSIWRDAFRDIYSTASRMFICRPIDRVAPTSDARGHRDDLPSDSPATTQHLYFVTAPRVRDFRRPKHRVRAFLRMLVVTVSSLYLLLGW